MAKLLKEEFLKKAKKDDDLRYKLAKANKCAISTVDRWLRENNVMLTTADNLDQLKDHYQVLEVAELLEQVETEQA